MRGGEERGGEEWGGEERGGEERGRVHIHNGRKLDGHIHDGTRQIRQVKYTFGIDGF